ncbi:3-hydroxyacyl-CoA dehydrogenase NAD-binding domain-containing protein [Paenalcaligenes faecalis]|uniref:3-hydroxyacyl-CoA dehydrogenase NAD-binding domain-containing protein n=1 Tax=Paenalcaligenes faecalis TaxID=2980099 RepID=UPI0022B96153|nr:3-hydroxyacyl-CoA dehydrogenase NAD-binding domain-containing protein [Paenalcaligenes faecalis]
MITPAFQHIAIVGGGVIGNGWAAYFALRGLRVTIYDINPENEQQLAQIYAQAELFMQQADQIKQGGHIRFCPTLAECLHDAELVIEALPEQLELKQQQLTLIESLIQPEIPIYSSSSGISPSLLQAKAIHPERILVAHPCNPPYLMPMVELVGTPITAECHLTQAEQFFQAVGKKTLRLNKEITGHVINRLQAALWREAVYLSTNGYASVTDVERAVTEGLGARWAVCGPTMIFHLSGGEEGLTGFMKRLAPAVDSWWDSLGTPQLDEKTQHELIQQFSAMIGHKNTASLVAERDTKMRDLLRLQEQ